MDRYLTEPTEPFRISPDFRKRSEKREYPRPLREFFVREQAERIRREEMQLRAAFMKVGVR